MKNIFINDINGKNSLLSIEKGSSLDDLKYQISDINGLNSKEQILLFNGKILTEKYFKKLICEDDYITIYSMLKLMGGMGDGLNVRGICENPNCHNYKKYIWINKGFDYGYDNFGDKHNSFDLGFIISSTYCTKCKKGLSKNSLRKIAFKNCKYELNNQKGTVYNEETIIDIPHKFYSSLLIKVNRLSSNEKMKVFPQPNFQNIRNLSEKKLINEAHNLAIKKIRVVLNYLEDTDENIIIKDGYYHEFFGKFCKENYKDVISCFKILYDAIQKVEIVFIKDISKDNYIAYTYKHNGRGLKHIWLNEGFFQMKNSEQAGTIIHELTHAFFKTNDHEYGLCECIELAINSPKKAICNADNYEFFAEKISQNL